MVKNIRFSKAVFDDLGQILKLQKKAFITEAELYENHVIGPMVQTIESIQDDFMNYTFIKAVYKNLIIGSVKGRQTGGICRIGRLIVEPEFQNKGIGKKLMNHIEKEFPNAKQYRIFTGNKSIKNIYLYQSLGYQKSEEDTGIDNPDGQLVYLTKTNN